jgi:adenine-specific DNA-methyltransferase
MRYIGNKTKILNEINMLLEKKGLKNKGLVFCDIFSGTGTVADKYNGFYKIIGNDLLDLSYHMTAGLLLYNNSGFKKLDFNPFEYFNNANTDTYTAGFCFNNFSPNGGCQYFTDSNAKRIDFIRDTIDEWYNKKLITDGEKSYLIMCLMEAVSKVSNVAGVYSAFLKIWDPRASKALELIPIEVKTTKYKNKVYCSNANDLIRDIKGDILYLDPPYTPTQYNSQYHVLETIVRNDNPETHGIGKHRNNDRLSDWCIKGKVQIEFERLIKEANFKHIIFSYSDKGIMSVKFIEAVLKRYAVPGTYTFKKINFVKYKSARAVNREIADGTENRAHYEYLFYIEKTNNPRYISPLNYIGGKFDALDLIKNNSPNYYHKFYDIFGGGATVGINCNNHIIYYNDINCYVVNLLEYLAKTEIYSIYKDIQKYIKKYGLEKGNKEAYNALRNAYNEEKKPILLYLCICYGFEHQIRFNSNHEFNNPCGNSGFNDEMYEKIISFNLRCNELNITFNCGNYLDCLPLIEKNDFVYLDPPYLSNRGVYQDGKRGFNGWDKKQENQMYEFMNKLSSKGVMFMLSNFTDHDGNQNASLIEWAKNNNYKVIYDSKITKRNRQDRREILVINY